MIYGTRNTVGIALATTILAFLVGTALGLLAATRGRLGGPGALGGWSMCSWRSRR
jgi:ABC-type dipeptide/oligopeptide/nickel transport system permease component